jgi:uncharacterized protein YqeY
MGLGLRERIGAGLKEAMRDKDATRLSTLRLISAAVKDQDIAVRAKGQTDGVGEPEVLAILGKMVKQRQESARAYEEGGRLELAEKERAEIAVIEDYLPRQLSDEEVAAAVGDAIAETGAEGLRDMGRVMGVLKGKYTGQMDFGAVGRWSRRGWAEPRRPGPRKACFSGSDLPANPARRSGAAQDLLEPLLQLDPLHRRQERPKFHLAPATRQRQVVRHRPALGVERHAHPVGIGFPS